MQEKQINDLNVRLSSVEGSYKSLSEETAKTSDDIGALAKDLDNLQKRLAEISGIKIPQRTIDVANAQQKAIPEATPTMSSQKIPLSSLPRWEDIVDQAEREYPEDVVIEDLLSQEEFQYAIEDTQRINAEFARKTKLNKLDISFIAFATALQTARWILTRLILGDLGDTSNRGKREGDLEGNKRKKKTINKFNERSKKHDVENIHSSQSFPTWKDILFGQYERIDGKGKCDRWRCPYDAQADAPAGFDDGGRGSHRVNTLGHDPILGWIFGTANLMTCTISLTKKFNFATYNVTYPGQRFGTRTSMIKMFSDVIESTKEDKYRLAAGLVAQYGHLKSDVFTHMGLPVPLIEAFDPETASKLYDSQYDSLCLLKDIGIVGIQSGVAILINMIIGYVHGFYYNKSEQPDRDLFDVRTRKILLISNSISSSINLGYVGLNAYFGNEKALGALDIGGLLVTIYRLFSDVRFMCRVKDMFIQEELDNVTKEALLELDSMFE